VAKNLESVVREEVCGRSTGDLPSVHDCFEGCANRNLGFTEADVAVQINGPYGRGCLHVDLRVDDRLHLVGRFAKRKGMSNSRCTLCRAQTRGRGRFRARLDREHFAGVNRKWMRRVFLARAHFESASELELR